MFTPNTLEAGLALYTAMHKNLESGDTLTDTQLAACFHDPVLGVLFFRICDYAHYRSLRGRLFRAAVDDSASEALEAHINRYLGLPLDGSSVDNFVNETLKQAITPTPEVRRKQKRQAREKLRTVARDEQRPAPSSPQSPDNLSLEDAQALDAIIARQKPEMLNALSIYMMAKARAS